MIVCDGKRKVQSGFHFSLSLVFLILKTFWLTSLEIVVFIRNKISRIFLGKKILPIFLLPYMKKES